MNSIREKVFEKIAADFQALSKTVMRQTELTHQLVENNRNEELYSEMEHNERIIDSLDVKMRDEVINVIVLYNPRATDLRKIISYYDMTAYLERIGDLLINVSGFLRKTDIYGKIFPQFRKKLVKLLAVSENMTQNAIFAFTCEDLQLARETIALDNQADTLHREIGDGLIHFPFPPTPESQEITDILCISGISYNLERTSDNATNIAEAAIYLMEGKNVKHSSSGKDILLAGSEG